MLFYNYDLVYDLANGLMGFVPPPPSTLYWVGSNGTSWTGVPLANNGIGQLSTGLPQGSYEPGIFDYKNLVAKIQANAAIVQRKVDYIKELGLGGAMFWELSGDTTDPSTSLLEVLHRGLAE